MTYPTDDLTILQIDGAGDDPSQARVELLNAVLKIQAMLAATGSGANNVPKLDGSANLNEPRIRLTDTALATLTSTAHAFQIGPTVGSNLIAGIVGIMARTNGVIDSLNLNRNGGDVLMRNLAHGFNFTDSEIRVISPSADRDFTVTPKGAAGIRANDGSSLRVFVTSPGVASAINWLTFTNAATGNGPIIGADGEANVDINITPKGGDVIINGTQFTTDASGNIICGTLTTGALQCTSLVCIGFTSTGIDDNAVSTSLTIDSNGHVLIGKTDLLISTVGIILQDTGRVIITANALDLLALNRKITDGNLQLFFQDDVQEGAISVVGTTITYGTFCGAHWSQLPDLSAPDIPRGTVVSTVDEMCEWYAEEWQEEDDEGNLITHYENVPRSAIANLDAKGDRTGRKKGTVLGVVNGRKQIREDNDQLVKFKVSDVPGDKRVYGVFSNYDEDGDASIHALGDSIARVTGPCEGGDLLESAGDGTARVQADDLIRSSTLGKVNFGYPKADSDEENLVPLSLYPG